MERTEQLLSLPEYDGRSITDIDDDQSMKFDALFSDDSMEKVRFNSLAFMDEYPVLSSFIVALVIIVAVPVVVFAGLVVLAVSVGVGIGLLVLAPVTVVPTIFMGTVVWACYVASRWVLGQVFRGTVGSENRVMMMPEASAMGNEAHGNLEINLVKVVKKEDGQPDQVS